MQKSAGLLLALLVGMAVFQSAPAQAGFVDMPPTAAQSDFCARFLAGYVKDQSFSVPYAGYAVSNVDLDRISDAVSRRMVRSDMDHVADRTADQLVEAIGRGVSETIRDLRIKPNALLMERMQIEGVLSWIRFHFKYNHAIGDKRVPYNVRRRYWYTKDILQLKQPMAVCNGFAQSGLDLVTLACKGTGVKAHLVNGSSRPFLPTVRFKPESNHSWLMFEQSDGHILFADLVKSNCDLDIARSYRGSLHNPRCLPITPFENALFLVSDMAMDYAGRAALPIKLTVMGCTLEQWCEIDARVLESLVRTYGQFSNTAWMNSLP